MYAKFQDLCGKPLGAADYIALAQAKHTLFLSGVPRFVGATRTEGYRFVTLIDVLYEHRCAAAGGEGNGAPWWARRTRQGRALRGRDPRRGRAGGSCVRKERALLESIVRRAALLCWPANLGGCP